MRPRNSKDCKEVLKFLDYLRKSKCTPTPTHLPFRSGYQELESSILCQKTKDDMETVTKECIEIKQDEIKHREENETKYYRN
jgi:hypothetical protein